MGRYFIEISYNGANYSGWQTQNNSNSVQETLQTIARQVIQQPILVVGSSRTDAGVHAIKQVAQFDFHPNESLDQVIFKLNKALPNDISVLDLYAVKTDTKARFDAVSRSYRYVICRKKDPFWHERALFWYGALNVDKMMEACQIIRNRVDFQAFSKVHTDVNHFNCNIMMAEWKQENHFLFFEIKANRFLRGMVRALVGTMLKLGKERISIEEFRAILDGRDRKKAGENVPACGLYLMDVGYPAEIRI